MNDSDKTKVLVDSGKALITTMAVILVTVKFTELITQRRIMP